MVAKGARGGLGNSAQLARRKGGNDSAGVWAQAGGLPEQACILLDRRLQADVALVGLPNAGKSSLLRALTAATPKVAPYAFTTTQPQLGALPGRVRGHWVSIADLPGLLQGAHRDRGLGLDFLKYVALALSNFPIYFTSLEAMSLLLWSFGNLRWFTVHSCGKHGRVS